MRARMRERKPIRQKVLRQCGAQLLLLTTLYQRKPFPPIGYILHSHCNDEDCHGQGRFNPDRGDLDRGVARRLPEWPGNRSIGLPGASRPNRGV